MISVRTSVDLDSTTGLLTIPELLTKHGIKHAVTFSGGQWGNMSPQFAPDEQAQKHIDELDAQLAKHLGVSEALVLTTPPENTLLYVNQIQWGRLFPPRNSEQALNRFELCRAHAAILEPTPLPVEIIVAPADCSVCIGVHPQWKGLVVMHVGAPQVACQLPEQVFHLLQANHPELALAEFTLYCTPYIKPEHYTIGQKEIDVYTQNYPQPDLLQATLNQTTHPIWEGPRWQFDFMELMRQRLSALFGINNCVETGVDTYESVQNGDLFSNEWYQEQQRLFEQEKLQARPQRGVFNVAVVMPR